MAADLDVDLSVMAQAGSLDIIARGQEVVVPPLELCVQSAIEAALQLARFRLATEVTHLMRIALVVVEQPGAMYRANVSVARGPQAAVFREAVASRFGNGHCETEKCTG